MFTHGDPGVIAAEDMHLWRRNAGFFKFFLNVIEIIEIVTDIVMSLHEPSLIFLICL